MVMVEFTIRSLSLRLVMVVVAFMLAHDVLMAMDSHAPASHGDGHHQETTQACGSVEGARLLEQSTPTFPASAASFSSSFLTQLPADNEQRVHQVLSLADASSLRAMLQVFLN